MVFISNFFKKLVKNKEDSNKNKKKINPFIQKDADPFTMWRNVGELGDGAFGKVFKAEHKSDQRVAALKQVEFENDEDLEDLMVEIDILTLCKHQNIVDLFEAYLHEGKIWMYIEFCGGGAIDSLMMELEKPLTEAQIRYVGHEMCEALAFLHQHNIIHRDLKAGNVLLTLDGRVKLADFGVSAKNKDDRQKRDTYIGTPYWMAPEVIACEMFKDQPYDYKADIWSFAITLIEFAETKPPNSEMHPMRVGIKIQKSEPPKLKRPHEWSQVFHDFLKKCLWKLPDARLSAEQLLQEPFIKDIKVEDNLPIRQLISEAKAEVIEMVEEIDPTMRQSVTSFDSTESDALTTDDEGKAAESRFDASLLEDSDLVSLVELIVGAVIEATGAEEQSVTSVALEMKQELLDEIYASVEPRIRAPSAVIARVISEVDQIDEDGAVAAASPFPEPATTPTEPAITPTATTPTEPRLVVVREENGTEHEEEDGAAEDLRNLGPDLSVRYGAALDEGELELELEQEAAEDEGEREEGQKEEEVEEVVKENGEVDEKEEEAVREEEKREGKEEVTEKGDEEVVEMAKKDEEEEESMEEEEEDVKEEKADEVKEVLIDEKDEKIKEKGDEKEETKEEKEGLEADKNKEAVEKMMKEEEVEEEEEEEEAVKEEEEEEEALTDEKDELKVEEDEAVKEEKEEKEDTTAEKEEEKEEKEDTTAEKEEEKEELKTDRNKEEEEKEAVKVKEREKEEKEVLTNEQEKEEQDRAAEKEEEEDHVYMPINVRKPAPAPAVVVEEEEGAAGKKEFDSDTVVRRRKQQNDEAAKRQCLTLKKVRKFTIDGQEYTTTTKRKVTDSREDMKRHREYLQRKFAMREVKRLQIMEQRENRELLARQDTQRDELELRLKQEELTLRRNQEQEMESLQRHHRTLLDKTEADQNSQLKFSTRRIKGDQDREMKRFRDSLKTEKKVVKHEVDNLPKSVRKEEFRRRMDSKDEEFSTREKKFSDELQARLNNELGRMQVKFADAIDTLESECLLECHEKRKQHDEARGELQLRHLQMRHAQVSEHQQELFRLKREQNMRRQELERSLLQRVLTKEEEGLVAAQNEDLKQLPKLKARDMKVRQEIFRQSLLIPGRTCSPDEERDRIRAFEDSERERVKSEIDAQERRYHRRRQALTLQHQMHLKELEEIHDEKQKQLLDQETFRMTELRETCRKQTEAKKEDIESLHKFLIRELSMESRNKGSTIRQRSNSIASMRSFRGSIFS